MSSFFIRSQLSAILNEPQIWQHIWALFTLRWLHRTLCEAKIIYPLIGKLSETNSKRKVRQDSERIRRQWQKVALCSQKKLLAKCKLTVKEIVFLIALVLHWIPVHLMLWALILRRKKNILKIKCSSLICKFTYRFHG